MTDTQHAATTAKSTPDDALALAANLPTSPDPEAGPAPKKPSRAKATTPQKIPIKLRVDADVLAALRASGRGWQTRINETLRAAMHLAGRI